MDDTPTDFERDALSIEQIQLEVLNKSSHSPLHEVCKFEDGDEDKFIPVVDSQISSDDMSFRHSATPPRFYLPSNNAHMYPNQNFNQHYLMANPLQPMQQGPLYPYLMPTVNQPYIYQPPLSVPMWAPQAAVQPIYIHHEQNGTIVHPPADEAPIISKPQDEIGKRQIHLYFMYTVSLRCTKMVFFTRALS